MKFIPYYRVSTARQGQSGLGLEAQQAAVEAFVKGNDGTILKSYTEVESGKRSDRPELAKAIAHAKMAKAKLVIAKLDRLARNVAFLSALMESGCDFVSLDNPHADRFTCHILAAVAEKEALDISNRTKAALKAYKARGGLLGASRPECRNLSRKTMKEGQSLGTEANQAKAKEAYASILPFMRQLRQQGETFRAIAGRLNAEGYTTRRGKPWSHVQVMFVLDRADS
jgi:DNA invertase Pin-like site-specific DNA recombinase